MTRLFLLEDDLRLATLLEAVVRQQPDFQWVGHSASVLEALQTVDFSGVDMLLADLDLGEESGVALIGAVAAAICWVVCWHWLHRRERRQGRPLG